MPAGLFAGVRRWRVSISSWAGLAKPRAPLVSAAATQRVREAMRELAATGADRAGRLRYVIDDCGGLPALWHLRPMLMQSLASAHGEREARRRIATLDAMFLQAWPTAPVIRG